MSTNKKTLIDGDFQVGSNHFIVDTENNYVGFNNATPQNKIDVQVGTRTGTHSTDRPLYVTGVTSTSGAEFVSDDGTAGIGIGSSNIFTKGTNQNLTIAPNGTGAVGINTATPNPLGETFRVWIDGDAKATGNVTASYIYGDGSGLTNIAGTQWVSSSEDIYFLNNTGSGEGRVSIGTSTPVSLLTLEGTSRGNPPTTGTDGTSNALVRIRDDSSVALDIGTTGASPWTTWIQSSDATNMSTNYPISLNPNGGNVGVGTSSPAAPLEVSKSAGGELLRLTNGTSTLYAGVDADPPWIGTSTDDHLRLITNGTEKVRIESDGSVGVGTMAPDANLHVVGNTYVSSNFEVGQANLYVDTTNSRVGVGTTAPDANLHVQGNTYVSSNFEVGEANLYVDTTNSRVGVGTVAPGYTLDVVGDINMSSGSKLKVGGVDAIFSNWTKSGNDITYTTGNVGIGTSAPTTLLEVNGTVKATSFEGTATKINLTESSSNQAYRVPFTTGSSGSQSLLTDAGLTYNPAVDKLYGTITKAEAAESVLLENRTNDTDYRIPIVASATGYHSILTGGTSFYYNPGTKTLKATNIEVDNLNVDNLNVANGIGGYTEVDVSSPDTTSGTWSYATDSGDWGDPKFNNTYNSRAYNDAPGYIQFNIPEGMKSAYISQLEWNNGGYVDVHGVQLDGGLVFLRRINTRQTLENSNEGDPNQHDGSTITFAGSGLHNFDAIRFTNKSGRFHLTGLAFTPDLTGTDGTGFIHSAQMMSAPTFVGPVTSTGHVYFSNSTQGMRNATGNYGTVQTVGSGNGNWEGYSINARYVFMSADNNSCGIYNDLDNEWMIYCYRNSRTSLYQNGGEKLRTESWGVRIYNDLYAQGNVTAYSDRRKKKNLQIINNPIEKIKKLNGYTYERTDQKDDKKYTGLIAQEVLQVLPEAVEGDDIDGYSLAYGNLAGLFVEAIKEMKNKLDTAFARIKELEKNIVRL